MWEVWIKAGTTWILMNTVDHLRAGEISGTWTRDSKHRIEVDKDEQGIYSRVYCIDHQSRTCIFMKRIA